MVRSSMNPATTALVLVGYQNEFFAPEGGFRDLVEDARSLDAVLDQTLGLLRALPSAEPLVLATPLTFSDGYAELVEPIGVLAAIRDRGLLRAGTGGVETIEAFAPFVGRMTEIRGRRGLDVFANTGVDERLRLAGIRDVVLAGAMTSLFVDGAARSAVDLGYRVSILSDCTAPRTSFEHTFFCEQIFPMYGDVIDAASFVERMQSGSSDG
jgi:nicotinamidase-related amidase